MNTPNEQDFSYIGGQFPAINIKGADLELELPNDHPLRADLLPGHLPADGSSSSSSSIIAYLNEPEAAQPWSPLRASNPQ
ncbi:uncharacterized protein N7473_009363 [Penicillium subrubescens]|uniref:Uncharacterized protein n=1 Tax=Penicillium subrubescens TaxID=1316194 RepID=A0A1Q5TAY0_9EURO|nr:uncharacterized protein N7473_009363 [Penicillium subrubescens]KAJ5886689.1 hypothetical protein N7473_009363 [Penicillium subrubescens]OKO97357.1 hypothetical protein PENSUB_10151 [Penicillium subrubescens]